MQNVFDKNSRMSMVVTDENGEQSTLKALVTNTESDTATPYCQIYLLSSINYSVFVQFVN